MLLLIILAASNHRTREGGGRGRERKRAIAAIARGAEGNALSSPSAHARSLGKSPRGQSYRLTNFI